MKDLIISIMLFILVPLQIYPQSTRQVRDDIGFCWTPEETDKLITYLESVEENNNKDPQLNLIAGISPHDDYLYAGRVYYPLYKNLRAKEVVIFGVTHGTVRRAVNDPQNVLILDEYDYWKGPYGSVVISPLRELIKQKLEKENYLVSNKAQSIEHSIEAVIPFLQYYNRDIKITPVMVTAMPFEKMEEISNKLTNVIIEYISANSLVVGEDIFFLISNDANHYGEDFNNAPYGVDEAGHQKGIDNDRRIANACFEREINYTTIKSIPNELWESKDSSVSIPLWCGRYA